MKPIAILLAISMIGCASQEYSQYVAAQQDANRSHVDNQKPLVSLTTSTAWRTAMSAIRFSRLGRNEEARTAIDAAALAVVKAQWDGFVTAITAQLGV